MLQDKICSLSNWIFDYKAYSCDSLTTRTSLHSYFNYTNNWDIKKKSFHMHKNMYACHSSFPAALR